MPYYTYILLSEKTGKYYTGSTEDLFMRLERHNTGLNPYTRMGTPWKLVYFETFETRSEAMARERNIKARKSSQYIRKLINGA